jgi:hypothetical protein
MVVAARNDNYGGDFINRLNNCVQWFFSYATQFKLPSEFIIVNYNPQPNEKQLFELIKFPIGEYVSFRIITVPAQFHERMLQSTIRKRLPMYEYVAKNIGIRRAQGEFILSANPDILIDPHIFEFVSQRKLENESYYRADRCNFSKPVSETSQFTPLLIRHNVTSVCAKGREFRISYMGSQRAQILLYKLKSLLFRNYYFFLRKNPLLAKYTRGYVADEYMCYKLHTNAAGDFLLMHRESWQKLKGHAQETVLPVHVDSLSVAAAQYSGLHEYIFFYPIYHQEHASRFRAKDDEKDVKKMYAKFEADARWMEKNNMPLIFNDDSWGFPAEKFEELIIN